MQNSQYVLAEKMVDAIHGLLGFDPTFRALHATGQLYRGTFKATPEAKQYTRAVHLQGDPVPVTLRFSFGRRQSGIAADKNRWYGDEVLSA